MNSEKYINPSDNNEIKKRKEFFENIKLKGKLGNEINLEEIIFLHKNLNNRKI